MLISDLARQYQKTTTSTEAMNGTRGVEKLVSSVRELTAGNIFEGTVNSIHNGRVVLGLSNGTELAARLDANMQLVKGQSMFFQVKSNDGATIAIRPYTVDGAGVNLTLLNALKAAGLPVTEKYLNMANTMMQEQMPIDKNSMSQMARVLMANPDMGVATAVQMKKLDIPITSEMAAQFENYMDDSHAVHKALDSFISEFPGLLSGKEMPLEQLKSLDSQLLMILAEGMEEPQVTTGNVLEDQVVAKAADVNETVGQEQDVQLQEETVANSEAGTKVGTSQENVVKLLQNIFGETGITDKDSPATLLHKLSNFVLNGENISKEDLLKLFSSKDMRAFLHEVMEEQMYLAPEDVADGEKVKKLYERLDGKVKNLENLLLNNGLKDSPLAQTVSDVRGNIDFMNQLNQAYTYVQIPLKMSGQNASGQLYVYTNKRDLADPERDLTAFLHLDMDHLGSTDVSVRLHRKDVDTKFYMDSDESYALVKKYMPQLQERLRKKGFQASIYVENERKKVNFVEDFLKKDAPSAGQLHRYSFDVRA